MPPSGPSALFESHERAAGGGYAFGKLGAGLAADLGESVEHGFEALLRDKSQVKVLVNPNPALADA